MFNSAQLGTFFNVPGAFTLHVLSVILVTNELSQRGSLSLSQTSAFTLVGEQMRF